jgi:hypothetical protein
MSGQLRDLVTLHLGNGPQYLLDRRLGGLSGDVNDMEKKEFLTLAGIKL